MAGLKGKKIFIFQQRRWAAGIGHFLAKKFQAEGCRLAALTVKKQYHDFIVNQKEVAYDMIISLDKIKGRPKEYLAGDTFSLKEICEELGVNSIWPLVYASRFYTKSYPDKYYYSFKQNVPDEGIIDYVMALYKCAKHVFDNFNPDVIIAPNFASVFHIIFNLYAKRRGVQFTAITDSKIRGQYIFTRDYLNSTGPFYNRVDELNNNRSVNSPNRDRAKKYIAAFRENFIIPDYCDEAPRKNSLFRSVRQELAPFYHILRWYAAKPENQWEIVGANIDWRPPRVILRDHYCAKKYRRFADNFNYYPLDKIKRCAYFPLQVQPEETIDVAAPYFNNQIEAARLAAMSLPDDYTLVVKDHPGMREQRPPSYLKKLARTANVKLVDYRLASEQIIKKADLIISPSGTTLAEAAFLRKPAIQLGDLGTLRKLPNVFHHTDMPSLAAKIKEILAINLNTEEYERRLENFVAAACDTGIDINYMNAWTGNQKPGQEKNLELLWHFYRNEVEDCLKK